MLFGTDEMYIHVMCFGKQFCLLHLENKHCFGHIVYHKDLLFALVKKHFISVLVTY